MARRYFFMRGSVKQDEMKDVSHYNGRDDVPFIMNERV